MKICCEDVSMQSSWSRFPGATTIDRDAVMKITFCIIFSAMSLGFFISWIRRCMSDPGEDVSYDDVIYFYSGCLRGMVSTRIRLLHLLQLEYFLLCPMSHISPTRCADVGSHIVHHAYHRVYRHRCYGRYKRFRHIQQSGIYVYKLP